MKSRAVRVILFFLSVAAIALAQGKQQPIDLSAGLVPKSGMNNLPLPPAWPSLHVGMEKQEALRKMAFCCQVKEIGIQGSTDTAGIVFPKNAKFGDISGDVYFRGNKVVGIAWDLSGSAAPDVYENGVALYRLLTSITRGEQRVAVVRTTTLEATNGTTRYIKFSFADGTQVSIQVNDPDPGSNRSQSVVLSQCGGTCADW